MGTEKGSPPAELAPIHGHMKVTLSLPASSLSCKKIAEELSVDVQHGLNKIDAAARLEQYGRNELNTDHGIRLFKILIHQISNAMILVLILATAVSFGIKSWIEGSVIAVVVLLNVVVGFFQEYAAEKTMNSLRALSSPTATVTRDGQSVVIPNAELVPGDIVDFKTGDTIPADIRLLESINFETNEALLTGESLAVPKDSQLMFFQETGPADCLNLAYSSSIVTKGHATGIVFATGMRTQVGLIAAALLHQSTQIHNHSVESGLHGPAKPYGYLKSWTLIATDLLGHFIGTNVGTPLQRKLCRMAILLFGIAIVCAFIVEASNKFSSSKGVIMYGVATGLSMIPASLSAVLIITMAVGTKRMVRRNVIVRKLDSLEALGAVTDICTDKTGTLTQAKMSVRRAWIPAKGTYSVEGCQTPSDPTVGQLTSNPSSPNRHPPMDEDNAQAGVHFNELLKDNPYLKDYLNVASMANLAHLYEGGDGSWLARGDPTEIAMQVFASRFDWNRRRWTMGEQPIWSLITEFPFDSNLKMMSVIYSRAPSSQDKKATRRIFSKGAVERVLDCCALVIWEDGGSPSPLTEDLRKEILDNMEALAAEGHRVLALADRECSLPSSKDSKSYVRHEVESNLNFLGLISLYDPPRPESAGAVKKCHHAGITVRMLTGDHVSTARAIATEVGILPSRMELLSSKNAKSLVTTAKEFDLLSDDEVDRLIALPLVVARCTPNTKVRMIEALHRRNSFAAMTGDGVNDAPSVKQADVGIAMGQSGSDVAKDASDIVLTDDNFASILNAIEEGRRMFDNIQKFVLHLLAENIAQALTLLIGLTFKDSSALSVFPLSPVEILWIIMITSGMPDMGLGMESAAPDILLRQPQNLKQGLFTPELMVDMLIYGIWMATLCILSFTLVVWCFGSGNLGHGCNNTYSPDCDLIFRARATTFVCLTWFALLLAWEVVSMRQSFFRSQSTSGSRRPFTQWLHVAWKNQFLFWAIITGFVTVFPTLYIPVINHGVFKHEGITWEWGIVLVEAVLFVLGVETWKGVKRRYFRKQLSRIGRVRSIEV